MAVKKCFHKASFKILKLLCAAISSLLAVFFNSGCMDNTVEYGAPHADFKVSGTVRSSDLRQPVKGIAILFRDSLGDGDRLNVCDTTDSLGKYAWTFQGAFDEQNIWILYAKDIDSIENGLFLPKDTVLSIPLSMLTGESGWYQGHGEMNVDWDLDRSSK